MRERQRRDAEGHLSGRTLLAEFADQLRAVATTDGDVLFAQSTDDQLRRMARDTLEALQLPLDRLPVLERDALSRRVVAQERVGWCRHLQVQEDRTHQHHPDTIYATDPNRRCICERHGYVHDLHTPGWAVLIAQFKERFCMGCPDRTPKHPG
jgi:hypothetical protein